MPYRPARLFGIVLILGGLALTSAQTPTARTFMFRHNLTTVDPKAAGTARVRLLEGDTTETVLTLRGLTPNRAYAAHYHALPAGTRGDPCASNGPVTLGFPSFEADTHGAAIVTLRAPASRLAGVAGAYINVHDAANLTVIPLCAVTLTGAPANAPATSTARDLPGTDAPTVTTQAVRIGDNAFTPVALTVKVGTTVEWRHEGRAIHNVIATQGEFRSPDLRGGDTYRFTFGKAGTYTYYCSYHEGMTATITVTGQ
ncbi:plastocyanin/azurin family copper-binding protein [Deinococcus pimensis]|uniref:plastocyanin/azurin family copper-binding protein n=1 Tax=Deinococcus pimensis TaxID=309888 RepID=UPI0004BB8C11|nr:plastocyanin/azurin family copper-binding protein [Deinococcus pimensis]